MTTRQLVEQARKQGYKIKVYERKGKTKGIRITNINGTSFRGSTGNTYLRNIMGNPLSEARTTHLKKITENVKVIKVNRITGKVTIKKGTWGNIKKDTITREVRNQIARIQKEFKKGTNSKNLKGNVSWANYRYNVKMYGYEEAKRKLDEAELYAKGYAYTENVIAIYNRLMVLAGSLPQLQEVADYVWSVLENNYHITDEGVMLARDELYELEKLWDMMSYDDISEAGEEIMSILQLHTRYK